MPSESPAKPAVLIESSTPESEESNEDEEQDIKEIETGLDENEEPPIPPLRCSTRKTNPPDYYGEWIKSTDGSTDSSTVSKAFSSSEKEALERGNAG